MAVDANAGRKRQREAAATCATTSASAAHVVAALSPRVFQFSAPQSAFISVQMAQFRLVPLADPQWQRLHQAFLLQFLTARNVLTLKQYKYEAIRVECEEHEAEIAQVKRRFPFDDAESRRARTDALNALTRQANARQRVHPGDDQWTESDEEDTGEEIEEENIRDEGMEEEHKEEEDAGLEEQKEADEDQGSEQEEDEEQDEEDEEEEMTEKERMRIRRRNLPPRRTITEEESKWILTQMEPYRSVPLGKPQWRRLYKAFLVRFPRARGLYSLSQYKSHTIELEYYRDEEKQHELSTVLYPGRPHTREIGAEYRVQRKHHQELARIKTEIKDRDRVPRYWRRGEDENGEEDEDDARWERQLEGEGWEDVAEAEETPGQPVQQAPQSNSRLTTVEALLSQKDSELEHWKAKCEALSATAELLKLQLAEKARALQEAEHKLRGADTATAAPTAAAAAASDVRVEAAVPPAPTQTSNGRTFVFNLYLNGIGPASQ